MASQFAHSNMMSFSADHHQQHPQQQQQQQHQRQQYDEHYHTFEFLTAQSDHYRQHYQQQQQQQQQQQHPSIAVTASVEYDHPHRQQQQEQQQQQALYWSRSSANNSSGGAPPFQPVQSTAIPADSYEHYNNPPPALSRVHHSQQQQRPKQERIHQAHSHSVGQEQQQVDYHSCWIQQQPEASVFSSNDRVQHIDATQRDVNEAGKNSASYQVNESWQSFACTIPDLPRIWSGTPDFRAPPHHSISNASTISSATTYLSAPGVEPIHGAGGTYQITRSLSAPTAMPSTRARNSRALGGRSSLPFAPTLKEEQDDLAAESSFASSMGRRRSGSPDSAGSYDDDGMDDSFATTADGSGANTTVDSLGVPMPYEGKDPEVFQCPHCDKSYNGKHARSIWRRHLQDKHSIPLSLQPRRTRWDGDANRPKNAEERRERMLESKRRWARKKRLQDKAIALGLDPEADFDTIQRAMQASGAHGEEVDEDGLPRVTQPTFSIGTRMGSGLTHNVNHSKGESVDNSASTSFASSSRVPSRPISVVQQQASDEMFFRSNHLSTKQPSSTRSTVAVYDTLDAPSSSSSHARLSHPSTSSALLSRGAPGHLGPNVTPVQHYAMLQPTPPSTGPSSAEREMHAIKQKMLADMFGSKYRPLPSPPTSNDKPVALYHTNYGPKGHNAQPLPPPQFVPRSSFLPRGPGGAEVDGDQQSSVSAERTQQALEEATETAATQLLALSSPPKGRNEEESGEGAEEEPTHIDSPTRSPLLRTRERSARGLSLRAGMSPRSNSVSGPARRPVEDALSGSPRRHASVEPAGLGGASRSRALGGNNPFSLAQHKISPPERHRVLPYVEDNTPAESPTGREKNAKLSAMGGPRLSPINAPDAASHLISAAAKNRLDELKLPPLVATPAFEREDPMAASMKRKSSDDGGEDGDVFKSSTRSKRPRSLLETISPLRPERTRGSEERTNANLFTPFHKSSASSSFDTVSRSILRPSLGLLGSVNRPSYGGDQFSSPQHLTLTSSLGLAPHTVVRGSGAATYGIDTPVPISKTSWPATVTKGFGSQGLLSSATRMDDADEASSDSEKADKNIGSSPVSAQKRKLANEATPSRRGPARGAKVSPLTALARGSPVKNKVST